MPSKLIIVAALGLLLAACGTERGERTLSGAGVGALGGAVLGPPGMVAGAVAGGAVGNQTEPDDVNLGKPIWEWR